MNSNSMVIMIEASFENELKRQDRNKMIEMIMLSVCVYGGQIKKLEISDGTLKPLM